MVKGVVAVPALAKVIVPAPEPIGAKATPFAEYPAIAGAPVELRLNALPTQRLEGEALTPVTVGKGLTFTILEAVAVHEPGLVTVTV